MNSDQTYCLFCGPQFNVYFIGINNKLQNVFFLYAVFIPYPEIYNWYVYVNYK